MAGDSHFESECHPTYWHQKTAKERLSRSFDWRLKYRVLLEYTDIANATLLIKIA